MQTTLPALESTRIRSVATGRRFADDFLSEPVQASSPLKCLVFCQDDCTGLRARTILRELVPGGSPAGFDPVEMRFNLMDSWGLWQMTLEENRHSAVVVISAHDAGSVPGEIISTLTYWVGLAEDRPQWVIVAFDSVAKPLAALDPNFEFLQTLAEKMQVEMRILHGEGPHAALAPLMLSIRQRTKAILDGGKRSPVHVRAGV